MLIKPLPLPEVGQLVYLSEQSQQVPGMSVSYPNFLDWREQTYPNWTEGNVVHIATSRSLSTTVLHLRGGASCRR